jgi:DNA-binding HxlR family transcriptional regulator
VRSYGQFCPIARTSELLAERWTPIIVRNLLNGCRTYNEIRQGAPGIPTALLSQRLEQLARVGVVERVANPTGRGATFRLTDMGQALRPVCDAMGQWGARWLEIQPHHLDPAYVLWATLKLVDVDRLPAGTTVVRVTLGGDAPENYWLILRRPQPELCTRGVGYVEDLVCETDARTLVELHLGRLTYARARRTKQLRLDGPAPLTRQFPTWFRTSPFAPYLPPQGTGRAQPYSMSRDIT